MAEGGGFSSIDRNSDADFQYTCSPCKEDDIIEEAVKYCPVCVEYMCATCARHHGRQKATRAHILQECDASINVPVVTMVTKCRYHPDRDVEMYCEEHDMVYCTMCIATEHRSCRGVLNLVDLNISPNQQKEIERLKSNTFYIQTRLDDTELNTQTNIVRVEEQRNDVISQIEETERDLVDHIWKLKHEALETLETEYTVVKENLNANISQIRNFKAEIERECQQLREVDSHDERQQLVRSKLIKYTLNGALKIIEEIDTKGCFSLLFTENTELESSIMTSTHLGHVQTVTDKYNPLSTKSTTRQINIKMSIEKQTCHITGICQLRDGTIILADFYSKRIKRLNKNYIITDYFDLGDYPSGVSCTGDSEVVVKLYSNKVQIISVGCSLSKLRDMSVKSGYFFGIAYCAGETWVSTRIGVDVYSVSGTFLKTISKDIGGKNIFKSNTQGMTVSGDTVIVTDSSDGAVCLRRDGTVIRELRDERLTETRSVCVSRNGVVFIAGYGSHNIVMFDRDGNCLGELLHKHDGLEKPISMCYDNRRNCVLVSNAESNELFVLRVDMYM